MSKMGRMNKILAMVMGMCASMPFEASAVKNRKKGSSKASASVSKSVSSKKVNSKKVNSKNLKKPLVPVFSSKGGKLDKRGRRSRIRGVKGVPSRFARVKGFFIDEDGRPTKEGIGTAIPIGLGVAVGTGLIIKRGVTGYWFSKPQNTPPQGNPPPQLGPVTTTSQQPPQVDQQQVELQGELPPQQNQNNLLQPQVEPPQVVQLGGPQPNQNNLMQPQLFVNVNVNNNQFTGGISGDPIEQVPNNDDKSKEENINTNLPVVDECEINTSSAQSSGGVGAHDNNEQNLNIIKQGANVIKYGADIIGQNLNNNIFKPGNNSSGLGIDDMIGSILDAHKVDQGNKNKKKAGNAFGKFFGNVKNIFNGK